jgi:hypothetical protein
LLGLIAALFAKMVWKIENLQQGNHAQSGRPIYMTSVAAFLGKDYADNLALLHVQAQIKYKGEQKT